MRPTLTAIVVVAVAALIAVAYTQAVQVAAGDKPSLSPGE